MKIQLVNPPISKHYSRCTRSGCYPPLDLLALATYLKVNDDNLNVEILDGELLELDKILKRIDGDIVGISPKVFSYESCLKIAKYSKDIGARVILGGSFVSSIPELIINNNSYVDAIVIGNGERAILDFSLGSDYKKIPNLVYRMNNSIYKTNIYQEDINDLPSIDYNIVDLSIYKCNYRKKFPDTGFKNPLSYYSHKGCYWYDKTGGCIYCRKQTSQNLKKSPKKFWSEIDKMIADYKIDLVWDVSDTFIEPLWLKEIVENKPNNIKCKFYIYGRASDINKDNIKLLKMLDCYEILIGVESGDDTLLKKVNKGITRESIINAVKLCSENKIQVFPTFLLGLPGENENTLKRTLSLSKEIFEFGNIHEISSAILLPLPGSRLFSAISDVFTNSYFNESLNLVKLQEIYAERYLNVSIDTIYEFNKLINSLIDENYRSSFGLFKKH